MGKLKETILYSRLKSGDKEAFVETYDLYVDKIYRFVYFKIGNTDEAQDLTSAIFLKAWNYIQNKSVTDYKTLKSLIYKIARASVVDYYREKSSKNTTYYGDGNEELENIVDEKQDVEKKVGLTFDLSIVENRLMELKDEYREIIALRFIDELSVSEIAGILDKTNGNVRVLIFRALKALRELMEGK